MAKKPKVDPTPDYRMLLLRLIGSLTLCDDMSDVAQAAQRTLELMDEPSDFDDLADLGRQLRARGIGTVYRPVAEPEDG